jgi:hypothetical protein
VAQPIILTEGDSVTYTITVKRAGAAVNLTPYSSIIFYAHDNGAVEGTNQVNGLSCAVTDAANGIVTVTLTATHSGITGPATMSEGVWALKLVTSSGSLPEYTRQEPFLILKNPFIVVA